MFLWSAFEVVRMNVCVYVLRIDILRVMLTNVRFAYKWEIKKMSTTVKPRNEYEKALGGRP